MSDPLPYVFEEAIQPKIQRMHQRLEAALGRALAPADIEVLIGNCFLYELQLLCISGNQAFRQNLVLFATGAMLEYLGELVGVHRQPSSGASCTIEFTLVNGHNDVLLPLGIRVQSIDGNAIFVTTSAINIPIGLNTVQVGAVCQTPGIIGNSYDVGKISIILDPQPFVTGARNMELTIGGTNEETDENLRERIKLAPASFSVAGPKDAYSFWAKSAHPAIVDVATITTAPGEVTLYPLLSLGELPSQEILNAVLSICNDNKIRPQNDTVKVAAPTIIDYDISVDLTTYTAAISSEVLAIVNTNLTDFKQARNNKLGFDVIRAQVSALCMLKDKVYNVNVVSPAADIIADEKTFPRCTSININIIGSTNG